MYLRTLLLVQTLHIDVHLLLAACIVLGRSQGGDLLPQVVIDNVLQFLAPLIQL